MPIDAPRIQQDVRSAKRRSTQRSRGRAGWILVLPALAVITLAMVLPIAYGFYLSFTSYNPVERGGPQFHGLDGYIDVLTSDAFWNSLVVTLLYTVGTLVLAVPAALGLALLVNGPLHATGMFRAIFYLPRVVPLAAVSMIWLWMYSHDGLFNYLLDIVGLPPVAFLTDEDTALVSLILMRAWKALGGGMIIFLAGLQSIPTSLLESAAVDGCGRWRRFRHVTLPLLLPITTYVVVVDLIYLAQSFSEIYILTAGGPMSTTTVVNMLIYNEAFEHYRIGNASAMAFLLFSLIFALAYLNIRMLSKGDRK